MKLPANLTKYLPELLLILIIVFLSIHPVTNLDFWFHVKYGEYIFTLHQLPFTDQFSHTAFGQPGVPYEWLFQLVIYLVYHAFGDVGVQAVVFLFHLGYLLIFRQILKEIFKVGVLPRMIMILIITFFSYNFWVERPQIVAYTLFLLTLYLILKRIVLGKNLLWWTIPVFLVWTNLHASMILGLYLFFSMAGIVGVRYFWLKDKADLLIARDLLLLGVINTVVTVLPPLGFSVYGLLWLFSQKMDFITRAIDEWIPLIGLPIYFYTYIVMILFGISTLVFSWFKKYSPTQLLIFLPLVPLSFFIISGIRHTPFVLPSILLLVVPGMTLVKKLWPKWLEVTIAAGVILGSVLILQSVNQDIDKEKRFYPVNAIPFIKANLKGNMLNDLGLGGYLMYHLGPEQKTFIDGRTDMFLPTVFPEYLGVADRKYDDDQSFMQYYDSLIQKYDVSWTILTTRNFNVWRKVVRLLSDRPDWHLVYFDDAAEIFVRDDGKNEETVKQYGLSIATPFRKKLYVEGERDQAKQEYQQMHQTSPSSVALNALGYIALEEKNIPQAKQFFEQALQLNDHAAAPKMNLAEISLATGDGEESIRLYQEAIEDDPQRGLAYLRLGEIMLKQGRSTSEAISIWQKGLTATPDQEVISKIEQDLKKVQNP